METNGQKKLGFGTAPVFFTAISTILGAILFLRFGMATGAVGFLGVVLIIFIGHLVTIPTALSLSEIATNQKVEGGGEYFIISRSFGLNIGATIGFSLYLSQAISVAFYIIAFTEAFEPVFNFFTDKTGLILPRQVISLPAMAGLTWLILKKGANMGVKTLYIVVGILFISLLLFFLGKTDYFIENGNNPFHQAFRNSDKFFVWFAICFPAFTGMTAGVGLSGDLRNPAKSIPLGTTSATIIGMILYLLVAWKLAVSASPDDLNEHQLIMSKIALGGAFIVPLGLAASTLSSAIGSVMVAPRTLQALGADKSLPLKGLNRFISKGKPVTNEPYNASIITCVIAFVFVAMGDVNFVAQLISMFFMITYGSLCLISFLYHFGADPSYRPAFKSKWYISLVGFLMCFWLMFKISTTYAIAAIIVMTLIYIIISYYHKERQGVQAIFQDTIFQFSRNMQVYMQKTKKAETKNKWRPSAICISPSSFERDSAFKLLEWISYQYGFGTYIHLIEDYFTPSSYKLAKETLEKLLDHYETKHGHVYLDTLISPSYTSAIAQTIQLPSITGMENNMIIFEYDKSDPVNLPLIVKNYPLAEAGDFDICILGSSEKHIDFRRGIHIWLHSLTDKNTNLMILLSYIIMSHPDWKKSKIKIYSLTTDTNLSEQRSELQNLINTGRLPISKRNIEIIHLEGNTPYKDLITERSAHAALTVIGFSSEELQKIGSRLFEGYERMGNVLFVNSNNSKTL
ncbi:MAG: amino acid permease [Bacteroidales bacterium]|nr:amino acid permease [Bacteroidales bacterium]